MRAKNTFMNAQTMKVSVVPIIESMVETILPPCDFGVVFSFAAIARSCSSIFGRLPYAHRFSLTLYPNW